MAAKTDLRKVSDIGESIDDLLLFPRKKLRVVRAPEKTGNPIWFISERLDDKVLELDRPTSETGEAISSGMRCAIIKDDSGKYVKLKGVAARNLFFTGGGYGLCSFPAGWNDQTMLIYLHRVFCPDMTSFPMFLNTFQVGDLKKKIPVPELIEMFSQTSRTYNTDLTRKRGVLLERYWRDIIGNYSPDALKAILAGKVQHYTPELLRVFTVSAVQTVADTRLDEVFYFLTSKPISGKLEKERNKWMYFLSSYAGFSKSFLTAAKLAWADNFKYTDAHLGNFVVFFRAGTIGVGLTDFVSAVTWDKFKTRKEFYSHCQKEVEDFGYEFCESATSSPATRAHYRHFPRDVKEKCFTHFKRGYNFGLIHMLEKRIADPRFCVPEDPHMKPNKILGAFTKDAFAEMCEQIRRY